MLARIFLLLAGLLLPVGALAVPHTDVSTANFDFTSIVETTQTAGDPAEMFGQPIGIAPTDALIFFPSSFSATSAGGGADSTLSLLQMLISSSAGAPINTINISEWGDTTLSGTGTAVTQTSLGISGFVTVLEVSNGVTTLPAASVNPLLLFPVSFNFDPTPADPYTLPANPGTTIWTGFDLEIDVATFVTGLAPGWYATEVQFSLDNQLDAFSETNSSATIQKKGQLIISVPEPGSLVALGSGVLMVLLHGRRRLRA